MTSKASRSKPMKTVVNTGSGVELTERLTNILVDEGDGDLLIQQNDRKDMQWLQALDMQVVGACRADERLKPLLKHSASTGAVEDNLLAHLSQRGVSALLLKGKSPAAVLRISRRSIKGRLDRRCCRSRYQRRLGFFCILGSVFILWFFNKLMCTAD